MAINTRFVWRALAISLIFHVWLLLQAPPRVVLPANMPLDVALRPIASAPQAIEPLPRRAFAQKAGKSNVRERHVVQDAEEVVFHDREAAPVSAATASQIIRFNLAEARKSYVFALAREAGRAKQTVLSGLPPGLRGICEVRVTVGADGTLLARLQTSSGNQRIDAAAVGLVDAALTRAPIPENLRGEAFDLVLPLGFGD